MFFEQKTLFSIARLISHPLRRDSATIALKRPSVAHLQVELDILKPRPDKIWIGMGDSDGYWQKVDYEYIPDYCQHCWHVGHASSQCHVQNPALKDSTAPKSSNDISTVQPRMHGPVANPRPAANQKYVPIRPSKPPMQLDQPISAQAKGKAPMVDLPSPQAPDALVALSTESLNSDLALPKPSGSHADGITDPNRVGGVVAPANGIVAQEVGFGPADPENPDRASSVDEEIEILDADSQLNLSLDTPKYNFTGVDDLHLLRRRDQDSQPYPFHSDSKLSIGSDLHASMAAEFDALRAFQVRLHFWLPEADSQGTQAIPKRRGRPRKTALETLSQLAVPTHPMVTRSLTHSTSAVFNE